MRRKSWLVAVLAMAVGFAWGAPPMRATAAAAPPASAWRGPLPRAHCGPGSLPETGIQGRVSADDVASGRAAKGYTCNTEALGHYGTTGGYRNYRYIDKAGHECAYFDTTLLFPLNVPTNGSELTGVWVLDMSDPAKPVRTATLSTPAMQSPHESLNLNAKRGLLAADLGNPSTYPASFVDVYDLSEDCRHPALRSSLPLGAFGHEGTFSPDGETFWVASPGGNLTAVDVSDPSVPKVLFTDTSYKVHGLNVSDDGKTLFYADLDQANKGVTVLDVSEIQRRAATPKVTRIGHVTWPNVSIPQVPIPVRIGGHPYLVEIDEFSSAGEGGSSTPVSSVDPTANVGAARIIDIADVEHPKVVSDIRLEANEPKNRAAMANDPGASSVLQGYAGHYCAVPQRDEPGIVACSFILSGLRVVDIRDPFHPKEIAYFNAPVHASRTGGSGSSYAMSAPAFAPDRDEIWYSDGNDGFYAVKITNGVWPFGR